MKTRLNTNSGFTLIEVLAATVLFALTVIAFFAVMSICNYMASYSKHRIQAVYYAQQVIEEQRRLPFAGLISQNLGAVIIDNQDPVTTADDYMGTATTTVTSLDAYRKRLKVEVDWRERTPAGTVTKKEFCTTDIANETQLN